MGRSWTGALGNRPQPRRGILASVIAIGSSERFPLVQTTGRPTGCQQQVVQRRVGEHDAQVRIAGRTTGTKAGRVCDVGSQAPGPASCGDDRDQSWRRNSRMGASGRQEAWASAADTSQYRRTSSSEGNIRANGRSGRRLRRRNSSTAAAFVASTSS